MKNLLAAALTLACTVAIAAPSQGALPPYHRMDFGPALFWTYQVAPGNIAQKGIVIRLDDGPGVARGLALSWAMVGRAFSPLNLERQVGFGSPSGRALTRTSV